MAAVDVGVARPISGGVPREAAVQSSAAGGEKLDQWVTWLSLLTAGATALLAGSLARDELSFGALGAVSSFSLPYFAALIGFAALAVAASERSPGLALYNVLMVAAALWLVPALIGASPPLLVHQYEMYGNVNSIVETGRLDPERLLFHSWPAWALEGAVLTLITGQDGADWVFRLTPFVVQAVAIAAIAALYRGSPLPREIGQRGWVLMALLFSAGNWTHVNAFLPQGIAFVFLIALLAFLGRRWLAKRPLTAGELLALNVLTVGVVIAHLPTSLALLAVFALLKWRSIAGRSELLLWAVVVVAAWAVYWTGPFLDRNLAGYVDTLARIGQSMEEGFKEAAAPGGASGAYGRIAQLRLLSAAALAALAVAGFATWALSRQRERMGWLMALVGLGFGSVAFMVAGGISASYTLRLYTFLLLPMSYFAARLARFRAGLAVVLVALAIGLPGHLVLQEGFQRWEHAGPSYLSGLEFFHEHTRGGTVAELKSARYSDPYAFGAYRNRGRYNHLEQTDADPDVLAGLAKPGAVPLPLYFVETGLAETVYRDVVADPEALRRAVDWVELSSGQRVYDSGGVRVWLKGR